MGVRLYQWFAVGTVVMGTAVTTFTSPDSLPLAFSRARVAYAMAFGCIAAAALGVDLPESNRRFSRLT